MEHQKILNSLNEAIDSKFVTRNCSIVNDQSNTNYSVGNEIIYSTEVLKSNLCDYNNGYILVGGNVTINLPAEGGFKNCAPFIKCIKKIDGTTINDAEDLALVMLLYNFLEYKLNYSDTTGGLCFYSKDEKTTFNNDIVNTATFKYFKYKAKLLANKVDQPSLNQAKGTLKIQQ